MENEKAERLDNKAKYSSATLEDDVSKKIDERFSELICGTVLVDCIISIRYIISDIGPIFNPDTIFVFSTICLMVLFIRTIPAIFKRINLKMICVLLFVVIVTILSFVFFPENNHQFINTCRYFYVVCLPTILVLPSIKNYDILKNKLYVVSRIICLIGSIIMVTTWTKYTGKTETYNMELGYSLLLPLLMIMYKMYEKGSLLDAILMVSTILLIVIGGSRGPLIAIVGFAIFLLIKKAVVSKKIIKTILIICTLLIALFNVSNILNMVGNVTQALHINSRTVRLVGEGLENDSGRGIIYEKTQHEIQENPLEIRGINADYNLLGIYTHNIALELLYQFGVILGAVLIVLLLYLIVETASGFFRKDVISDLSVIFMASSIPCLLFSNSLWIKYEFWLWVTMSIIMILAKRYNKKGSN